MTTHHTRMIDGLRILYREAGDVSKPTLVLLHGFPTSSHMFLHLIPALAVLNVTGEGEPQCPMR